MTSPELRILDVNLNRLREALRVVEDYARFAQDDGDAAATAKRLRHEAREIAALVGPGALTAARDILGDVGRDERVIAEIHRETLCDVAGAALGRAQEAARGICEYSKLTHPAAAERAEKIRHAAYELEQRLVLRGDLRRRFRAVDLYVIITRTLCRADWMRTAEAALRGGANCLQLREKALTDADLLEAAHRLRELTAKHGALFIVNDRPDIAVLAHADGVHVGQDDLSVGAARRVAGASLLIGKSTHNPEQFQAALAERPDYIAMGPMFATATKPQSHIAGVETLRGIMPQTELPIVAIGGVTAANAGEMIAAGANCVCACSSVIAATDAEAAARELHDAIRSAKAHRRASLKCGSTHV